MVARPGDLSTHNYKPNSKEGGAMIIRDYPNARQLAERTLRGIWLVRVSTLFAICLEVVPLEADVITMFCAARAYCLAWLVKLSCLTLIMLPLLMYMWLNGPLALAYVKGRVAVIAVIVAVHLVFFISTVTAHGGT